MVNQIWAHQKDRPGSNQPNKAASHPCIANRLKSSIKVASYLWVPAGLLISFFFGRTIARCYAMMPGVMSEAFLMQTVCPLIKTQIRVFFGWTGVFATLLVQGILAWASRPRGPGAGLLYGR